MIGKLVKNEIAQRELSNSAARSLHFESFITRFIKSGRGGTDKLLRGYPPFPLQ